MKVKKESVGVFTTLPAKNHEKLQNIAADSKMTLKELTNRILLWAGEVGEEKLRNLGVPLPIWPEYPKTDAQNDGSNTD